MAITKQNKEAPYTVRTSENINVVDGNTINTKIPQTSIMVSAQSDLAKLADYPAGVLAFTAGYKQIWQKAVDGTWVEV